MNTLFKITLVAGVVASAMNIPAPAEAGLFSGLRGMFAPQSDLSAFEGRYVDPQNVAWQQAPTQAATTYAQSSYSGSNYVPSAARTAEPGVRYYTAEEYYGQNRSAGITGQNIATPKRNRWGFKPWSYGNVYD